MLELEKKIFIAEKLFDLKKGVDFFQEDDKLVDLPNYAVDYQLVIDKLMEVSNKDINIRSLPDSRFYCSIIEHRDTANIATHIGGSFKTVGEAVIDTAYHCLKTIEYQKKKETQNGSLIKK